MDPLRRWGEGKLRGKCCLATLLVGSLLVACASASPAPTEAVPTVTPPFAPWTVFSPRLGVYVTDEASALPLSTSDYDVYLIGEAHGIQEIHLLTLSYLQFLHQAIGLRDIILEEDQVYERAANAYVLGHDDTFVVDLCLRADILEGVRVLNETLPETEMIRVHLVDVGSPLSAIYAHLQILQEQVSALAEPIQMPSLAEFEDWSEGEMLALVDQLVEAAGNDDSTGDELDTVRSSIHWYALGNEVGIGQPIVVLSAESSTTREEAIARNIQNLLEELEGAPVLSLFGGFHAQKWLRPGYRVEPWAQILTESGVNVYSVVAGGVSGTQFWRGETYEIAIDAEQIVFDDGTTLATVFDTDYGIVYVDLRLDANALTGPDGWGRLTREVYDGVILFREVSPMENACPYESG